MKKVLARGMEVYAGFMEHTDHHVGRLLDSLKDLGILENTLIYVVIGAMAPRQRVHCRAPSTR